MLATTTSIHCLYYSLDFIMFPLKSGPHHIFSRKQWGKLLGFAAVATKPKTEKNNLRSIHSVRCCINSQFCLFLPLDSSSAKCCMSAPHYAVPL